MGYLLGRIGLVVGLLRGKLEVLDLELDLLSPELILDCLLPLLGLVEELVVVVLLSLFLHDDSVVLDELEFFPHGLSLPLDFSLEDRKVLESVLARVCGVRKLSSRAAENLRIFNNTAKINFRHAGAICSFVIDLRHYWCALRLL